MLLLDYHWLSDLVAGLALGILLLRLLHAVDRLALRDWPGRRERAAEASGGARRPQQPAGARSAWRPAGGGAD